MTVTSSNLPGFRFRPFSDSAGTNNAPTENWFNSRKNERVHGVRYETHTDLKASSFEYIEVFYAPKELPLGDNRKREHFTLGYNSPVRFLKDWIREPHQEKLTA